MEGLQDKCNVMLLYLEHMDYAKMTVQELIAEEKKIKRMGITSTVAVGILIGIMVYGVARNGFGFLYIVIPLVLIVAVAKNSQSLKGKLTLIRAEISSKSNN